MADTSGFYVLAGTLAVIIPQTILENYKRHAERQAVAHAFAGEIEAILELTTRRKYLENARGALELTAKGILQPRGFFDLGLHRDDVDPVFDSYISRLGILGGTLPKEIGMFYARLGGIRIDLIRLAEGSGFTRVEDQHRILAEDIPIFEDTLALGKRIVVKLDILASKPFLRINWWFGAFVVLACVSYFLWAQQSTINNILAYLKPPN